MTRKNQIIEAGIEYTMQNNPMCIGGDNFYEQAREFNRNKSFEAGAKWADENPKSPWINVKDRLPYQDSTTSERTGMTPFVCAITIGGGIVIAQMIRKNSKWYWINDKLRQLEDIVYWMYIPNPPNNTEN